MKSFFSGLYPLSPSSSGSFAPPGAVLSPGTGVHPADSPASPVLTTTAAKVQACEGGVQQKTVDDKRLAILEKILDGYFELDRRNLVKFCNGALMALLQYSPREILGLPVSALPHSEDYIFFQKLLFRLASASTDRESFFVELIGKNRRTVQVEGVIVALKNEGKEIIGFHGAVRDITRQKVLEEERRQLEEELRQAKKLEALGQLAECSSRPDISR